MASVPNTIKVKQMDEADLADFILSLLNSYTGIGGSFIHQLHEIFEAGLTSNTTLNALGALNVSGVGTFNSGLISNDDIVVHGNISGESLSLTSLSLQSGTYQTINIGQLTLTGVPIFDSGNLATALALPSGSVFGIKQFSHQPTWECDNLGQLMPATGVGSIYIQLCVSIGT